MSSVDANDVREAMEGDICIIGAGAAGISLAKKLMGAGKKVVLAEAGGYQVDERCQKIYEGEHSGLMDEHTSYLVDGRQRCFGGSTMRWAGWCRPLDPFDFEKRDWLPYSGWPLTYRDVAPYLAEASRLCEVSAFDDRTDLEHTAWWRPPMDWIASQDRIESRLFFFSPPTQFGVKYRDEVMQDRGTQVVLYANCVDLKLTPSANAVQSAHFKTFAGNELEVRARTFVLACGGLENARLLLNFDREIPYGIGNETQWVGRCFMEHPHLYVGRAVINRSFLLLTLYLTRWKNGYFGHDTQAVLVTSEQTQRTNKTLGFSIQLEPDLSDWADPLDGHVAEVSVALDQNLAEDDGRDSRSSFRFDPVDRILNPTHCKLFARSEQAPNPDSRVTLTSERDELGHRRLKLDWRVTDLDVHSWEESARVLGRGLIESQRGRVKLDLIAPKITKREIFYGYHHMGTTRMSPDPSSGVVDRNCKVHRMDNLYIAGSSVFTTSGYSNPTHTLVALALRLGDHLKARG